MRSLWMVSLCVSFFAVPALSAPPPALSAKEQSAVFAAAGFKAKGGKFVRCEEEPPSPSYVPGSIEVADLNHDGLPEAWIVESSTSCYGMTGEAFVLVTRDAKGAWHKILDEVGIADVKDTKRAGWPDIEVGGPGMGPFPRFRFDGTKYVATRS
jgi:hypothetical protein